jgi:inward rectifier potassium channel
MFRIVNERSNQLTQVEATVSVSLWEQGEGAPVRKFHELALERKRVVFMPLHWVIVHPIDESSPLHGMSEQEFTAADAEVLILLTALDETFSQTVHTRSSYKPQEVVWGAKFADMFHDSPDGRVSIDVAKLHQVEKA